MTFKHVKFEDSPIMRSLEKVAQEKGLIKAQPLTKTAAVKKANLTPTTNLTDNVLKLCAGLREQGFEKQAKDLEYNLIAFKQAQTLYEAFPEKGEDLVERAHPEGSHKLEDVDSDEAVFEDILDQMAKSLKVVEKKPTGKLSSAQGINAVRTVLGQTAEKKNYEIDSRFGRLNSAQLEQFVVGNVTKAVKIIQTVGQIVKPELTFFGDFTRKLDAIEQYSHDTRIDSLEQMRNEIDHLTTRLTPGNWVTLGMGGVTKDTWATVEPMLAGATRLVNEAMQARGQILARNTADVKTSFEDAGTPEAPKPSNDLIQKFNDAIRTIGLYKARIQSKGLANAATLIGWLDNQALPYAQKNLSEYSASQFKDDAGVSANYSSKLNTLKTKLDAFQQRWSI